MRKLLLLLALPLCAFAVTTTCTFTGAAGTYNLSATAAQWGACGHIPLASNAEVARLPNGVTMHVDQNWSIGDSAATTTAAMDCTTTSGTCSWTIDFGVTWNPVADVYNRGGNFIICGSAAQSGCQGSGTVTTVTGGTGAKFYSWTSTSFNQTATVVIGCANCTKIAWSGLPHWPGSNRSPATAIRNVAFTSTGGSGSCAASTPSTGCALFFLNSPSGTTYTLADLSFTTSGGITFAGLAATDGFAISNIDRTDQSTNTAGYDLHFYQLTGPTGGPTRSITNYTPYGAIRFVRASADGACGVTVRNIYGRMFSNGNGGLISSNGAACTDTDTDYAFQFNTNASTSMEAAWTGTIKHLLGLSRYTSGTGDLDFSRSTQSATIGSSTDDGPIVQPWWTGSTGGDPFSWNANSATAAYSFAVRYALLLKGQTGGGFCTVSAITGANLTNKTHAVEHNTTAGAMSGSICGNGTYEAISGTSTAGSVVIRSNLEAATSAATTPHYNWAFNSNTSATIANDSIVADYNYRFNITGAHYKNAPGVWTVFDSTTGAQCSSDWCSTHDSDAAGDPKFADPARDFGTWCQMLDASFVPGTTEWSVCVAKVTDVLRAGHDARYCAWGGPLCAYEWIRDGYRVQNPALRRAAHDGGDIGATRYEPTAYAGAASDTVRVYVY